jgi:methionyl-tRNA formyltransferase
MANKPRIVFFGNERIATGISTTTPVLRALIEQGYDVVAVVANYERGKSRNVRDLEVALVAEEHNIPLLLPDKLGEIKEQLLLEYKAEAGVLIAYGKIISQSIIDIFPKGIINIHPSLLPLHRGPIPIESVILDGSDKTGVSLMQLAKEMDAGPVYGQSEVELTGTESKQELVDTLLEVGSSMLVELLPGILSGDIIAKPQDDSQATYDKLITKDDGILDFHKSAEELEREIRAFIEWPKSRTVIGGKDVIITKAHVIPDTYDERIGRIEVMKETNTLMINCSQGYLAIDALKPAGKPEMPVAAFLNGYKTS